MKIGIGILTSYRFHSLNSECGGEYRYLLQVAATFQRMGHQATVFVEPAQNQPEFVDAETNVQFAHYPRVAEFEPDLIISQETHFFTTHCVPLPCRLILFTMGNPDHFPKDLYSRLSGVLTYNRDVPNWLKHHRNYQRGCVILHPSIRPLLDVPRDPHKILCATTELYSYNRPLEAVAIAQELVEFDPFYRMRYYYRAAWLQSATQDEQDEQECAYLREVARVFENPPVGFLPTEFEPYEPFQERLKTCAAYLVIREGARIALTESEALFHGACVIRLDEIPYIGHLSEDSMRAHHAAHWVHFVLSTPSMRAFLVEQGQNITRERHEKSFETRLAIALQEWMS